MFGSLFNKVAGLKVCNFFKNKTLTQVFPVDIAKFLRIVFLCKTSSGCFWKSYHGSPKSAGVPVLRFRTSTCFRFLSKTFTKRCTNKSLPLRDKTIYCLCLNWLVTCFRFQNVFWKNINCFRFWWKTYTKRCASNYVILSVKRLSSPVLCGWPGAFNFRVRIGKRKNVV